MLQNERFYIRVAITHEIFRKNNLLLLLGCLVLLCDFHREQAWGRWLRTSNHGCTSVINDVQDDLRDVANAKTEEAYQEALEELQNSEHWKEKPLLSKYITDHYLSIKQVTFLS